jgi:hypothetical protein
MLVMSTPEILMIAVYTLAVALYTTLANCEFSWLTFFISFWVGIAAVMSIMFIATDEVAKQKLPKYMAYFSLPFVFHAGSHVLNYFGFVQAAKFSYFFRYFSLLTPLLYFFVNIVWVSGERTHYRSAYRKEMNRKP